MRRARGPGQDEDVILGLLKGANPHSPVGVAITQQLKNFVTTQRTELASMSQMEL